MYELIELLNIKAPSGNEDEIKSYIYYQLLEYCDEVFQDEFGNLIAKVSGMSDKKVMLATGIDCKGYMVTLTDKDNRTRFEALYSCEADKLVGKRATFTNGTVGIIASDCEKDIKLNNLYIDILGAEANVGDIFTINDEVTISDDYISSGYISYCIGAYALIQIAKRLEKPQNTVYFVFCTQNCMNHRGAKTAAYGINPDFAVCVGASEADNHTNVKVGNGPAIRIMDKSIMAHPYVKNLLLDSASAQDIPYQLEITDKTASECGVIHLSGSGIPSGAVSVPVRYKGTESELCLISDAQKLVDIFLKGDIL